MNDKDRRDLIYVSGLIRVANMHNRNASDLPQLVELVDRLGTLFLIICPEVNVLFLASRKDLNINKIPPGYFVRPRTDLAFYVLKKEHRNVQSLMNMDWL